MLNSTVTCGVLTYSSAGRLVGPTGGAPAAGRAGVCWTEVSTTWASGLFVVATTLGLFGGSPWPGPTGTPPGAGGAPSAGSDTFRNCETGIAGGAPPGCQAPPSPRTGN